MHHHLPGAINPNARTEHSSQGFATSTIFNLLNPIMDSATKHENILISEVGARAFALFVRLPGMLIGRLIDGVIAVPLTLASCLTLGKVKTLNSLANAHLSFPQLITDLYESLAMTIKPAFFNDSFKIDWDF